MNGTSVWFTSGVGSKYPDLCRAANESKTPCTTTEPTRVRNHCKWAGRPGNVLKIQAPTRSSLSLSLFLSSHQLLPYGNDVIRMCTEILLSSPPSPSSSSRSSSSPPPPPLPLISLAAARWCLNKSEKLPDVRLPVATPSQKDLASNIRSKRARGSLRRRPVLRRNNKKKAKKRCRFSRTRKARAQVDTISVFQSRSVRLSNPGGAGRQADGLTERTAGG